MMFPPRLRAVSIVPRWSILWTLQQDYLSNHSYFVAIYAHQIAGLLECEVDYAGLLWCALLHDLDEVITGDIVGVVKPHILDKARAGEHVRRRLPEMLGDIGDMYNLSQRVGDDIKMIIKAADQLDAILFIAVEMSLGNGIIGSRWPLAMDKMRAAWFNLPGDDSLLIPLWENMIVPAINDHLDPANFDLDRP